MRLTQLNSSLPNSDKGSKLWQVNYDISLIEINPPINPPIKVSYLSNGASPWMIIELHIGKLSKTPLRFGIISTCLSYFRNSWKHLLRFAKTYKKPPESQHPLKFRLTFRFNYKNWTLNIYSNKYTLNLIILSLRHHSLHFCNPFHQIHIFSIQSETQRNT